MRLTTGEIKDLILECSSDKKAHKVSGFREYIEKNGGKEFTPGQLAGSVAQLVSIGMIEKLERGVYILGPKGESALRGKAYTTELAEGTETISAGQNFEEAEKLKQSLMEWFDLSNQKLTEVIHNTDILLLDQEGFSLLIEVKRLNEEMSRLRNKCEE